MKKLRQDGSTAVARELSYMKVAILANAKSSFPKVLAAGLHRMLERIRRGEFDIHHGLDAIENKRYLAERRTLLSSLRLTAATLRLRGLAHKSRRYDAIVIIGYNPAAFMRGFWNDHQLRGLVPDIPNSSICKVREK